MTRNLCLCCLGAVALVAVSCARGGDDVGTDTAAAAAPAADPSADRARAAAAVANAMAANPAAADSILTAAGYTRDSFQELMYDIAADSAMSAVYAAAKAP